MSEPVLRLGGAAPGGLGLPPADPTPGHLYAPRGVWFDDQRVIVSDTGNHRILIWHSRPSSDGAPADVVLGQPDFESEGPNGGGRGPVRGVHLPTGVTVVDGRLVVADAWNHRVLMWNGVPETSDEAPVWVLGQDDLESTTENRGGAVAATGLYWPYAAEVVAGVLWVTDTGNRRVLGWNGMPESPDVSPDVLLGQDDFDLGLENRGEGVGPRSFRWPHAIAGDERMMLVADAGNHRVLGWGDEIGDRNADVVLGQPDFSSSHEWPYGAQSADGYRFPYSISTSGRRLVVADTANNRVLGYDSIPDTSHAAADFVLGQPDFSSNGENQWQEVRDDTLCWPYGIHLHGDEVAIADSGNNRVMIWKIV